MGVWKRAEDAEVVLGRYSAECRGSAVGREGMAKGVTDFGWSGTERCG